MKAGNDEQGWRSIYWMAGVSAVLVLVSIVVEMGLTAIPEAAQTAEAGFTAVDWLTFYAAYPFLGMRNMGLINLFLTGFSLPALFGLFGAHRRTDPGLAGFAIAISLVGAAVFYANNRAFPLLGISQQYAATTDPALRAALEGAAAAMLATGQSHTPGTFLGFFLSTSATILMAVVMLRGGVFGKLVSWIGIVGFGCLLVYDAIVSFNTHLLMPLIPLASVGGLALMAFYVLIARRFFGLAR